MSYFKSLKIKSKLLVITIIPMLTIILYSCFTINNLLLEKENLSLNDYYILEMESLSKLIHYLKIEQQAEKKRMHLEIKYINEHEKAERARTELLKTQIDPHFMFNNFSILTELINEDSYIASKFLAQLSKVYRYIITNLNFFYINKLHIGVLVDNYIF